MKARLVDTAGFRYPDLKGVKAVVVLPNTYYRKKMFSIGVGYVATALARCGIEVECIACDAWSHDDVEIAKEVVQSQARYYFIGGLFPMLGEIERGCRIIRTMKPEAVIIVGGAAVAPTPRFVLDRTGADAALVGEADFTVPLLMEALEGGDDLETVPGIAFYRDGRYIATGGPTIPKDISTKALGMPDYDPFPMEHYIRAPKFHPIRQSDRMMPVITARGCPYNCNFCFNPCVFRMRSIPDVVDEIQYLRDKYALDGVYFYDDLLMVGRKRIEQLHGELLGRGIRIKFTMTGRVNVVNRDIIRMLKEAGCVSIFYGIESGSQEILDSMGKKIRVEQVHEAVAMTRDAGITCNYGFMFGQPGDGKETAEKTLALMKSLVFGDFPTNRVFGCIPFPGTRLYDWCLERGILAGIEDFYEKYHSQDYSLDQYPINMTGLKDKDIHEIIAWMNGELQAHWNRRASAEWGKVFSVTP